MQFQKTVLKNGMRIITIPQPNAVAMTGLVLVEAGSKYETKNINGLSHFLEHMCFKGTTKRPNASQIASELDGLGAQSNAFTAQEYTGYYSKVSADKGLQAIEIISDLYLDPIFDGKEIEKEKGVIIEELHMYEDLPQRRVAEYFMNLLYGDQPAGWDIGGHEDIIRTLTREQFIAYRQKHYVPHATALIVAGAIDETEIIAHAKKLFEQMPDGEKAGKLAVTEAQTKPQAVVKYKKSDQAHLVLGVRAFDMFDNRRFALELLGDILGGGMSSRLFQLLREQMGAAYYVRADADLYTDHGYFAAAAGVELSKVKEAITGILREFKKMATHPVSEEELQRAKSHLTGNMLLGLETSDALAVFYGMQEILKREITSTDDVLEEIKAVSAEDIQRLAKELFTDDRLNLAIIGPYEKEGEFREILSFA